MAVGYPFGRGANRKGPLGVCDRCGITYRHGDLVEEYKAGRATGVMACPDCWDPDEHQNFPRDHLVGELDDPKPIRNPRPDSSLAESREIPS